MSGRNQGRVSRVCGLPWRALLVLTLMLGALALSGCKGEDAVQSSEAATAVDDGVQSDDLSVTRVALYQNGVGYFERRGHVTGDEITLRIRPDQINDILKSLTVIDMGEGRPVSISLPVDKQAVDELSRIPAQIREDGGLLSLLQAFRGARVSLTASDTGTVTGRVVGLENLERVTDGGQVVPDWRATIKDDGGTLKVVALDKITSLHMEDRTLEVGLEKSLDISLNEGSWKPIELKVRMNAGAAERDILVSYIVSMPVWKPAYRLVLGEADQGLFQGWAVVDNVSGTHWGDVSMSLVAGTPMSFIYDLYRPQFVNRPDLTPRGRRVAMAPEAVESANAIGGLAAKGTGSGGGGYGEMQKNKDKATSRRMAEAPAAAGLAAMADESGADYGDYDDGNGQAWAAPAPPSMDQYEGNFQTNTAGSQVSALFQYDIGEPVTVPDRSSALVNLMQSKGDAREIVLFQPELYGYYTDLNPSRAVEFMNKSGYALEPGPITLYKQGTFIGEGFLQRTDKDEVAFVTFALDPQVRLSTNQTDSEEAARINRIEGGTIYSEVKAVTTVTYELTNERDEALRAVVRRPVRAGYKLDPMPEGTLEAGTAWFIPVELKPGEKKTVELREVTPVQRSLTLDSSLALDLIKLEVDNAQLDPELEAQLQDVIDKQEQLGTIRAELYKLRQAKSQAESEQTRVANSLATIAEIKDGAARKLRSDLVERASKLEADIAKHSTRIAELSLQETDIDLTLRALFGSVSMGGGD